MHDGSQGNAMTEIALALAMGFFSLPVLTLVSMGAGHGAAQARPWRPSSRWFPPCPATPAGHRTVWDGIFGTDRAVLESDLSRGAARPHGRGPAPAR